MPNEEVVVGSFPKNKREEVRVTLSNYKGHNLLNIRVWFKSNDGEFRPSRDGISIRIELLPSFRELVDRAYVIAAGRGLVRTEGPQDATAAAASDDVQNLMKLLLPPR